jgi:hypothetical protein
MERRVANVPRKARHAARRGKTKERRSALHPPRLFEGLPDDPSGANAPRECVVMAALVAGIHVLRPRGTSPAMTMTKVLFEKIEPKLFPFVPAKAGIQTGFPLARE